jgi:hypothetical protein
MNVGKYNTDVVKDKTKKHAFFIFYSIIFEMQEKRHTFRSESRCPIDFVQQMAAVCATFQTDPVKNYITAQYFVSSLPGVFRNVPN